MTEMNGQVEERSAPGSDADIVGPADPEAAARAAVEQYFASQKGDTTPAAPAPQPAAKPSYQNTAHMNAARRPRSNTETKASYDEWLKQHPTWAEEKPLLHAAMLDRLAKAEPEADPTEQQDAASPAEVIASEDYVLELNVPLHHQSEHDAALVREFEDAAFGVGLPLEVAQGAVDAIVDAGIALRHFRGDGVNAESTMADLNAAIGEKPAASIIKLAQHNAQALGLKDYLDKVGPDGRQAGNDVATLLVLANAGVYRMTKQEAETRLSQWVASPEYRRGDPHAVVAVRMLGQRVYKSEGETPKRMLAEAVKESRRAEASAKAKSDANTEAAAALKLMKSSSAADRAEGERRWLSLVAKI
jgi:hypothetical protein